MTVARRATVELPQEERTARGAGRLFKLGELLPAPAAAATPLARLEHLDGELASLLQVSTPATWRHFRRAWRELVLSARRELASRSE